MITGQHIAETAETSGLIGTPYSKLDCQALVEEVLKRAGLKIPNYRGSNHMWRSLVYDRAKTADVTPIPGSLAFILKDDGGEKARGYHDDMGNAAHVAIVIDADTVFESTKGGVQYGKMKRFNYWAKVLDVDYSDGGDSDAGERPSGEVVRQYLSVIRDNIDELERYLHEYCG